MDSLRHFPLFYLTASQLVHGVPRHIQHMLVCQPVKNAVTSQNDKVMKIGSQSKLRNFRLRDYYTFFTTVFR